MDARRNAPLAAALGLALLGPAGTAHAQSFTNLGFGKAYAISADGSTIVGESVLEAAAWYGGATNARTGSVSHRNN